MAAPSHPDARTLHLAGRWYDAGVTLICWGYFTLAFVFFFSPAYLLAYLSASRRQERFQRLNTRFYRGFFHLLRAIAPRQRWRIADHVSGIRSAVIVCNHLSYLDPLLMISLFSRHKTVVKSRYFSMPIFGWVLRHAGYFPADAGGKFSGIMIEQVEGLKEYLAAGGVFFIFPEGRRSRNGRLGTLHRGAIKIARLCKAPIHILRLQGTDNLFAPGTFFFNARLANTITLEEIDRIDPEPGGVLSLETIEARIKKGLAGASHAGGG